MAGYVAKKQLDTAPSKIGKELKKIRVSFPARIILTTSNLLYVRVDKEKRSYAPGANGRERQTTDPVVLEWVRVLGPFDPKDNKIAEKLKRLDLSATQSRGEMESERGKAASLERNAASFTSTDFMELISNPDQNLLEIRDIAKQLKP